MFKTAINGDLLMVEYLVGKVADAYVGVRQHHRGDVPPEAIEASIDSILQRYGAEHLRDRLLARLAS